MHQMIIQHGLDGARARAETKGQRQAIDAAGAILAEEEFRLGITHAGFAMTSLPHKRTDAPHWKREGNGTKLFVESGIDSNGQQIGVPYGSFTRLILLYLQTEAIRTNSPEVELGRSMKNWMLKMSLTTGGQTYRLVSEQARRISACRLTFFTDRAGAEYRHNGAFVRDAISMTGVADERQPSLWQDKVRLDDGFWESLKAHPVPVLEEAVKAIGAKSMAIDVYIWLAYRLHVLSKSTPVSWAAIHAQLGADFLLQRKTKALFLEALALALAVYPQANVDVEKGGIVMHASAPAVAKLEARRLGVS
jgi:hypothetical protein